MARKESMRAKKLRWQREAREEVDAYLASIVHCSGAEYLARIIDRAPNGELEIDQLDHLDRSEIHPDNVQKYLVEALRDGVLELVRRGDEEWVRRPVDAKLLALLDRKGRRRGLRYAALERLLHVGDGASRLVLCQALGRQVERGRVALVGQLYRFVRPP
jgi:hypothetical protein